MGWFALINPDVGYVFRGEGAIVGEPEIGEGINFIEHTSLLTCTFE
jgi:hypothetical protein